ncbi:hypothetical protein BJ741DRAFT_617496 [Chytriomyces cf. hyalinus JEL632]|nr:hypothetical protein BJ741DRAFT_617496 [Chytriomyces cf. hyalinus JEL632]
MQAQPRHCRYFHKPGGCPAGTQCNFKHGPRDIPQQRHWRDQRSFKSTHSNSPSRRHASPPARAPTIQQQLPKSFQEGRKRPACDSTSKTPILDPISTAPIAPVSNKRVHSHANPPNISISTGIATSPAWNLRSSSNSSDTLSPTTRLAEYCELHTFLEWDGTLTNESKAFSSDPKYGPECTTRSYAHWGIANVEHVHEWIAVETEYLIKYANVFRGAVKRVEGRGWVQAAGSLEALLKEKEGLE